MHLEYVSPELPAAVDMDCHSCSVAVIVAIEILVGAVTASLEPLIHVVAQDGVVAVMLQAGRLVAAWMINISMPVIRDNRKFKVNRTRCSS